MDPSTILLAALAVAGYFLFAKDDKSASRRRAGRYGGGPQGWGPAPYAGQPPMPGGPQGPGPQPPRTAAGPGPLLDQLDSMIAQALAVADPDDAVAALKVAGQFGASQVGPAVDRQTQNRSKALTSAAAHDNGMLQAIPTSKAGLAWATTILFPFALLPQLISSTATSALTPATSNDKMKASGLVRAMYEKYSSALDQFGGPAVATGPAVAGSAPPSWDTGSYVYGYVVGGFTESSPCVDAVSDPQTCAMVASALANEMNPAVLRTIARDVAGAGFPGAANTLLSKADSIG